MRLVWFQRIKADLTASENVIVTEDVSEQDAGDSCAEPWPRRATSSEETFQGVDWSLRIASEKWR